jgi:hypothetical protein
MGRWRIRYICVLLENRQSSFSPFTAISLPLTVMLRGEIRIRENTKENERRRTVAHRTGFDAEKTQEVRENPPC